jgi:hypothetical protein
VHVRSGGNFISSERIGNVAFMFRATEAVHTESILLPLEAFSATSLVFHGVFFERLCVLGLRSQVCDWIVVIENWNRPNGLRRRRRRSNGSRTVGRVAEQEVQGIEKAMLTIRRRRSTSVYCKGCKISCFMWVHPYFFIIYPLFSHEWVDVWF